VGVAFPFDNEASLSKILENNAESAQYEIAYGLYRLENCCIDSVFYSIKMEIPRSLILAAYFFSKDLENMLQRNQQFLDLQ